MIHGKEVNSKNPVEKELVGEVAGIPRNFFVSQKLFFKFKVIKNYARLKSHLLLTRFIRVDPKIIFE